jgi:hypothetical protein
LTGYSEKEEFAVAKRNVHVVPSGNKWVMKTEGSHKPLSTHRTQTTASEVGRRGAQQNQSELVIHRPNGQIRDKDSFGTPASLGTL